MDDCVLFSEQISAQRTGGDRIPHNRTMASGAAARCSECERIAREINEALADMVRATNEGRRESRKRTARALEDKRQHELRTGHKGPT